MKQVFSITRKELDSYFGSPMALIFVGIFLLSVHFSFFWVSGFFGRGIADIRPLFQWMPVLLIFLIATLTMRQWSEEQQTGTLEMLLTLPVRLTQLVLGKFLAVLILVGVALAFTLSLPITVGINGRLDLGPVIGGYLAAILMASAYIAIGLFVSSRTDNQIVSLLLTAIVCGIFYLVGAPTLTSITSAQLTDVLRLIGTGSRFESIERGVIDLRDLVYYGSLTLAFLILNILSLDSKRWSVGTRLRNFRFNRRLATVLLVINLVIFNVLVNRVGAVRADLTQSGEYTLSSVTADLLKSVQEPLLIRGYFSQENHPLIAPLIPIVRDTLEEYRLAGRNIQVEIVDPLKNPALEQEANQTYGIRPAALPVSGRGKTSVINAYNTILIRYGDQNETLNLLNMVENRGTSGQVDIQLRNLEYDLTSAIKKVVFGFQNIDAILASLKQPAQMTLYVTPKTLPDTLKTAPDVITKVANTLTQQSNGKLVYRMVDVSDPKSGVTEQSLYTKYQIQPLSADFLSPDRFYLHILLEVDGKTDVVYPSNEISESQIKSAIEGSLKRAAPGFLHVIGLWTSEGRNVSQLQQQSLQQYSTIQQALQKDYQVQSVDLTTGRVATNIDALMIIGPQKMTDVERYAVDQFLMRGGSVFVAAGNFQIGVGQDGNLALLPMDEGLQDMLASYGVTVEKKLVMDTQNSPFPVQVQRNINGVLINDVQAVNYPQFVDVRANAMDRGNNAVSRLESVTLHWVSPITLSADKTKDMKISTLLQSTANSWSTTSTELQPNTSLYPDTGFPVEGARSPQTLAVAVQGSFSSFFAGKSSPIKSPTPTAGGPNPTPDPKAAATVGLIAKSPDTARLIVVGSAEFLNDTMFSVAQNLGLDLATSNVQFVQNSAEWFVEDAALSTIRAKGDSTRLLKPLSDTEKSAWEIGNYAFALLALIGLGVVWQVRRRSEKPMALAASQEAEA